MHQILWLEILLKLGVGLVLVVAPLIAIRILGLAPSASGFWPRLAGGLLIGIAGAVFVEGAIDGARGLGMAGLVVLNVTGAALLAILAAFGAGAPTRRGTVVLWAAVVALMGLALVEIAYS